jgi:hypothetical protein
LIPGGTGFLFATASGLALEVAVSHAASTRDIGHMLTVSCGNIHGDEASGSTTTEGKRITQYSN